MKIGELMSTPLSELLNENFTMVDLKPHTNEDGDVISIELKYASKDVPNLLIPIGGRK